MIQSTMGRGNELLEWLVVDSGGFCFGEALVDDTSNAITAIPELLPVLNITGPIVTTDAAD